MAKSPEVLGKELEDDCIKCFKALLKSNPFYYDRIYDTKSARQYIPVRPGDFYIGYNGKAAILECKASSVHASLKNGLSALVDSGQVAKMRLWIRSGNKGFYLFRSELSQIVEIWDGADVVEARNNGKPINPSKRLLSLPRNELQKLLEIYFTGEHHA